MVTAKELWLMGDINRDGVINQTDRNLLEAAWNTVEGDPDWNAHADLNQDGRVSIADSAILELNFGKIATGLEGDIVFPALAVPAFTLARGQLLNVTLLGVGLVIPPRDITFWERTLLTPEFVLFNINSLVNAIVTPLNAIPQAVWNFATSWLEQQINEYYKLHPEEKEE